MFFPVRIALVLAFGLFAADAQAAKIRIKVEDSQGREQRVFLSRPLGLAADRPVVFVMHGVRRNAEEYRDQWHDLAEEHDFLLVVPEFSARNYPGAESYNLGNLFDDAGRARPESEWSFSRIEPIFDAVRERFGMTDETYAIYGHSAGAQFVHRFVYFVPDARARTAVAANAGWYTMPSFEWNYPYGLEGSGLGFVPLFQALERPLTFLLGEADIDPEHPSLRRSPGAMAQGPHRFARGQAFFAAARKAAEASGAQFGWRLATVPGADHDNRLMAPAAVPYLLEP